MSIKISVIIPTYNRSALLAKAIESVLNQTLSKDLYRVIVVDNASRDNTREVCERYTSFPWFRYVYEEKSGLSAARMRGIRAAGSPYVTFTDDDAVASPQWLEKILYAFKSVTPKPGAVGGKIIPDWEVPAPDWLPRSKWNYLTVLDYGDTPKFIQYPQILYGANMAFDRTILLQYAEFRQDLGRIGNTLMGGDDSWIFKRFNEESIPVYYLPDASISHFIPKKRITKTWLYRRHYWQGRTEIMLLEKELSGDAAVRLRRDSLRQAMRDLRSFCIVKARDRKFSHFSNFVQHCGRVIQLRRIGKSDK
ncbi:MAG: glycosyltransferase family 2 protein [Acidobacteria bacterium]|nr:glycosyltransferase family 2 protein [Acidobacteriota bacterium]